jgi:hypothetical protein
MKVRPDELRKLAFELLRPIATSRFRLRVAQWMVDPATPPESRDKLNELIDRTHPDGLEASVVLLQSDFTPAATKGAMMEQFASYSSQALGSVLGLPGEPGVLRVGRDWPSRVIQQLWNAEFCGFLEGALGRVASFEDSVQPVVLAGTVPVDSVRSALYQTLSRHWTDGPAALASAGLPEHLIGDPGLILMVQQLVYEEILTAKRTVTQSSSARRMSAHRLHHLKAAHEAWQGELGDVAEEWEAYLESLQSAMCRRLFATSMRRGAANLGADLFELHADARVVAAYHHDSSRENQATARPVTADPMEVQYVRIDEETRPAKMLGFYRRRLTSCKERDIENGIALESLHTDIQSGQRRSLTVRIVQAMPEVPRLPNQDQPLIVEILSIEMNDPGDPRWETARLTEN